MPERPRTPTRLARSAMRRREGLLLAASLTILAPFAFSLGASFLITPEQIESGEVRIAPECQMRRILGHPCPTCGLTRAFAALSHGRTADALGYNRAAVVVYAIWWLGAAAATVAAARAGLRYVALGNDASHDPISLDLDSASAPAPEASP